MFAHDFKFPPFFWSFDIMYVNERGKFLDIFLQYIGQAFDLTGNSKYRKW